MRCKVKLVSITKNEGGYELVYQPVTYGSPENQTFFKHTPYGEIKLGTVNENVVKGLEPGQEYYVDFMGAM